jgi:hypothetical protein
MYSKGVGAGRDETVLYLAGTWQLFVAEVWAAIDVGLGSTGLRFRF